MTVLDSIGDTQVLSLARLIHETTGKLVEQYKSAGYSVPSLDLTDPGPFDASGKASADLTRNIRIITGACAQLSIAVSRPSLVINNKGYGFMETVCLKLVYEAKIADLLMNAPDGIHINELAVKSGFDAGKLGRVLRLFSTGHCFKEVQPDVFANNRISVQLCSDNLVSSWIGFLADECFPAACYLSDTISIQKSAPSLSFPPNHASTASSTTAEKASNLFITSSVDRKKQFAKVMVGHTEINGKFLMIDKVAEGTTICDVAGGNGHLTLDLARKFPILHIIVQDLPTVLDQAKQYWNENLPVAIESKRVQFIEFDFFKDPPAPECKWYLTYVSCHISCEYNFKAVVANWPHDWPDAECVKILSNVRKAMFPDSRLLIYEFILQHVVTQPGIEETRGKDQAPEPMLANYGLGGILPYQQDMLIMTMLNGQERNLEEFISLTAKAGLQYEKHFDMGGEHIMEFSAIPDSDLLL